MIYIIIIDDTSEPRCDLKLDLFKIQAAILITVEFIVRYAIDIKQQELNV